MGRTARDGTDDLPGVVAVLRIPIDRQTDGLFMGLELLQGGEKNAA
ncbi:hypothetical protein [Allorhizocola rhizosphaerae]|nr:hypothetical protein [Allorhizocola rhizosphaerae]